MRPEALEAKLPESRLRIGLSLLTPPSLLALVWGAWAVQAPVWVTAGLLLLALFLGYVVAFDFSTALQIDSEGIHRLCLLRRETLRWEDIAAIVQPRRRGLILVTKDRKRRILLDRRLDSVELDLLRSRAQERDVRLEI